MSPQGKAMARFWNSHGGKYPPAMLPHLRSDVEDEEAFEHPELRVPITPLHGAEWLDFSIRKPLSGFGGPKPTCEEFVAWFQPDADWPEHAAAIIYLVLGDLHRRQGMPGLWRLRDTLGVSIRDIAAAMRKAEVTAAYPCLWINRYAWDVRDDAGYGRDE